MRKKVMILILAIPCCAILMLMFFSNGNASALDHNSRDEIRVHKEMADVRQLSGTSVDDDNAVTTKRSAGEVASNRKLREIKITHNGTHLTFIEVRVSDEKHLLIEKKVGASEAILEPKQEGVNVETIQDAFPHLNRLSMLSWPRFFYKKEGNFYFSGGGTYLPVNDFSDGVKVSQDGTVICF